MDRTVIDMRYLGKAAVREWRVLEKWVPPTFSLFILRENQGQKCGDTDNKRYDFPV
jgi:hypothetical protein